MKEKVVKLGFISGLSGVYGWSAQDQLRGVQMAADFINKQGGIAGRKIEVLTRDDRSDPKLSTAGTRELIEKEKADFIIGGLSAGTVLFINEEAKKAKKIFVSISQNNEIVEHRNVSAYTFHEALTPHMTVQGMGKWVFSNIGKKCFIIIADYEWGWQVLKVYTNLAEKMGAEIVGVAKVPFPAKKPDDFTKHFARILKLKPEVLIAANYGEDQLKCIEDINRRGLKNKMSIVHTLSELPVVKRIKPEDAVGMYWGVNFYWGLAKDIGSAKKFVESYRKKYGAAPSGYSAYGYSGAMELMGAAASIGQYPVEPLAVCRELEGRAYSHYKKPQWWRPCDHQSFQDYYILKLKGPEERKTADDVSEIIGVTSWDLDMERSCQVLGHVNKQWGHAKGASQ